jgi:hypothetical protein
MRHAKGYFVATQRISSVWQYNDKNQVTAYLNEFMILGEGSFATNPYTTDNRGEPYDYQKDILERARERALHTLINEQKLMTHREFTKIILPISEGKSTIEVAELLSTKHKKLSESRVLDIRKEILVKAKKQFNRPFHGGIAELIEFFVQEGLVVNTTK